MVCLLRMFHSQQFKSNNQYCDIQTVWTVILTFKSWTNTEIGLKISNGGSREFRASC